MNNDVLVVTNAQFLKNNKHGKLESKFVHFETKCEF